ncbi:MAG: flavodoxin [Fretibacterium sp.]|nr:flavodoxin [Fretibacterium sp.]
MSKVLIVYWSGTGNTEKMAELITEGAREAGAETDCKRVGSVAVSDLAQYDVVAFGSPSMGAEVIEEAEMEPFFVEALPTLKERKTAIFGSYGWGDGEWLKTWSERLKQGGAVIMDEGLAVQESPDEAASSACRAWGAKLASF